MFDLTEVKEKNLMKSHFDGEVRDFLRDFSENCLLSQFSCEFIQWNIWMSQISRAACAVWPKIVRNSQIRWSIILTVVFTKLQNSIFLSCKGGNFYEFSSTHKNDPFKQKIFTVNINPNKPSITWNSCFSEKTLAVCKNA